MIACPSFLTISATASTSAGSTIRRRPSNARLSPVSSRYFWSTTPDRWEIRWRRSDQPFLGMSVGDLLNPGGFEQWSSRRERDNQWLLEITKLEHILWRDQDARHSISVYTRYVRNDDQVRKPDDF
jgi:hypothetical protein